MNKITTLFPGGFKPLTGAHLALAQRYATHPDVDRVILLISSLTSLISEPKSDI